MTSVLVVGMVVVDFVFTVDAMPVSAEKYVASDASMVGGGGAANAAVAISNLGGRAQLCGRIGDDMIGGLIVNDLQQYNVDCTLLQRTTGARSSYSSVLIDSAGERLIVNYRGQNLSDDVAAMSRLADDNARQPSAVLADTRWRKGVIAAMQLARQLDVPGILDAEAQTDAEALRLASHIAFSKQGLVSLTGNTNLEQSLLAVAETYESWLCVTDGANGVYYIQDEAVCHVPAPVVEVVDTLGAGDVWHGAFALAMANKNKQYTVGQTERDAILFANAAASLTCSCAGGGRVSPTQAEVYSLLNSKQIQ